MVDSKGKYFYDTILEFFASDSEFYISPNIIDGSKLLSSEKKYAVYLGFQSDNDANNLITEGDKRFINNRVTDFFLQVLFKNKIKDETIDETERRWIVREIIENKLIDLKSNIYEEQEYNITHGKNEYIQKFCIKDINYNDIYFNEGNARNIKSGYDEMIFSGQLEYYILK